MSGNMELSQQVSVTLPLGAWNTVLSLMAKGPWDVVDPLMQVLRSQIIAAQQPKQMPPKLVNPAPEPHQHLG